MKTPTPLEIADVLRKALAPHVEATGLDFSRLRPSGTVVMETPDGSTALSDAILDACFPRADLTKDYFHYTSLSGFEGIITSGEMWLFWFKKRLKEHEYKPFCDEHGLDGYTTPDPHTGLLPLDELCRDLFILSVTEQASKREMWDEFGDRGKGVRLKLKLTPCFERSQLRYIRYARGSRKTIIGTIQETLKTNFGLRFILRGFSRAPAFNLPMFLDDENETRLLIKRFTLPADTPNPWQGVRSHGPDEYLPLTISNPNDFCQIDLQSIGVTQKGNQKRVKDALSSSPMFSHLAVESIRY